MYSSTFYIASLLLVDSKTVSQQNVCDLVIPVSVCAMRWQFCTWCVTVSVYLVAIVWIRAYPVLITCFKICLKRSQHWWASFAHKLQAIMLHIHLVQHNIASKLGIARKRHSHESPACVAGLLQACSWPARNPRNLSAFIPLAVADPP